MPWQSILIGIVVAIVGYFLQQRAWRHKTSEEIRQREFDECMKLIEKLGSSIDQRLMSLSTFKTLLDSLSTTQDETDRYKESIRIWMHEFSSFKSKIYHYFGRAMMLQFEDSVHSKMREASDILLRTNKFGKSRLSKNDREAHDNVIILINIARYESFKFLRELNEMLANEEIGRTAQFNNIEVGKLELISRGYLIQRLLGLKS